MDDDNDLVECAGIGKKLDDDSPLVECGEIGMILREIISETVLIGKLVRILTNHTVLE